MNFAPSAAACGNKADPAWPGVARRSASTSERKIVVPSDPPDTPLIRNTRSAKSGSRLAISPRTWVVK